MLICLVNLTLSSTLCSPYLAHNSLNHQTERLRKGASGSFNDIYDSVQSVQLEFTKNWMCPQTPNFDRETKRDSGVKPTNHSSVYLGVNSCVHRHINSPVYTYSNSERQTWIRLFSFSHILTQPHMKVSVNKNERMKKISCIVRRQQTKHPWGPNKGKAFTGL